MKRLDPTYWLKATNFAKHAEEVKRPVKPKRTGIERIDYEPIPRWNPELDDPQSEANRR
jgi:hypothetical protein